MMIFLLLFGVLLGSQVPSHFMSISQEGVTVSVAADRDDRHQFHIQVNSELGKEDFKVRLDLDVMEGLSIQDSSLAILGGQILRKRQSESAGEGPPGSARGQQALWTSPSRGLLI